MIKTAILLLVGVLLLQGCVGAGYNFGCEGRQGTTQWCKYNPP